MSNSSLKEHAFMNMKYSFSFTEGIHILSCRKLHHFYSRQIAPVETHTPSGISPGAVSWTCPPLSVETFGTYRQSVT